MRFSRFFIDRPIFAAVLSIIIFVAGLMAMFGLPVSEYPEVVPPSVVVRAIYPGANPRVISEAVATPLEEQINGVENMLYMSSQATSDGVLTLTVTFRVGTDVEWVPGVWRKWPRMRDPQGSVAVVLGPERRWGAGRRHGRASPVPWLRPPSLSPLLTPSSGTLGRHRSRTLSCAGSRRRAGCSGRRRSG